jgi:hypothetical protein
MHARGFTKKRRGWKSRGYLDSVLRSSRPHPLLGCGFTQVPFVNGFFHGVILYLVGA